MAAAPRLASVAVGALAALVACSSSSKATAPSASARMDFARPDFYAAPFPSDDLRNADGTIALGAFPNPDGIAMAQQGVALLSRDARGFGTTSGVFFALTGAIDPSRLPPSLDASTARDATVQLVNVEPGSPEYLARSPIHVAFEADGGPFGAPNLVSAIPLQGAPLRPATLYAAIVLRGAADPPLDVAPAMKELAASAKPAGLSDAAFATYQRAIAGVVAGGVAIDDVAAMTAFTTDAPLDTFQKVLDDILAQPRPKPGAFELTDTYDGYCVYHTTIGMPDYQEGTPPFDQTGGDWAFDASGKPVVQRIEQANLFVTVPRATMPAGGWPTAVFIRTGESSVRPIADRSTHAQNGGPDVPGQGPAMELARAGFAGVEVDGPLGGLRNTTNANEDFTIFNVFNAGSLRDSVRESAVELVLMAHVLDEISIDASGCAGASARATLDTSKVAIMGHSMGASILPLAFAFEPRFGAAILSGAGGSWIENVMEKKLPIDVRPALEIFLGYQAAGRTLTDHDPVLSLFQWTAEPADAQIYARRILREPPPGAAPRHVLMVQGIVDHYILPPIANALSAPLGLDLAGPELDGANAETAAMPTIASMFPFDGRGAIAFPARANFGGASTAVVVQHPADGIEDGHEVIFQRQEPKHQYQCFLASWLKGVPVVLDGAGTTDQTPCE